MIFRVLSGVFLMLSLWSAYLQLNDPDPGRWIAIYLSCACVASFEAFGKSRPKWALLVATVALCWALAILPELFSGWSPRELAAKMTSDRPDIEYGREFGGLMLVFGYCSAAFLRHTIKRRATTS
jgi:hypothetical protein